MYTPMDLANKPMEEIQRDLEFVALNYGPCDIVAADIEAGTPDKRVQKFIQLCEELSENYSYITRIAAPVVLLAIGLIYIALDFRSKHHHHHFEIDKTKIKAKKSKTAVLISLCIGMFLSPCIEIEAYYFQAATKGWLGILIVSSVYLIVTLTMMVALVYLGLKGVNKMKSDFLERHEKLITGLLLIFLGLFAYFVEF